MLSESEIQDYNNLGYIVKKNFFSSDEVNQFNNKLETIIKHFLKKNNLSSTHPLDDGFMKLDELKHENIHIIYNIIKDSDALNLLTSSKKVFNTVRSLMNKDINDPIYNMYGVSRMDPPADGRFLYKWHQESFYTIPQSNSIQLWAPLIHSSSKENGTIDVLVGSHVKELPHRLEKVIDGHEQKYLDDSDIKEEYETLTVELDPSDALFFHPYLIHKSNNNISQQVRYSLVSHYLDPLSIDYKHDITDLSFSDYHRQRCVNYEEYIGQLS